MVALKATNTFLEFFLILCIKLFALIIFFYTLKFHKYLKILIIFNIIKQKRPLQSGLAVTIKIIINQISIINFIIETISYNTIKVTTT